MPNGFYHDETYKAVCCWTAETRVKYVSNPKSGKSFVRYAKYEKAKTVEEALQCGSFSLDLLFDFQTGKLSVTGGPVRKEPVDPGKAVSKTDKVLSKWYYRAHPAKLEALRAAEKTLKDHGMESFTLKNQANALDRSERTGISLGEFSDGMLSELDAARKGTDIEAKAILESGKKITSKICLDILRKWKFRENVARQNVLPEGHSFVFSDTLGLIRTRDGRYMATGSTENYPHVMGLFNKWLKDNSDFPIDFPFTSISVNSSYAARIHRDQGNHGPSICVAFGKFTGGRLEYWDQDNKSLDLDALRANVTPTIVDTSKGPRLFDGRRAHAVEPMKGERFSLIFFSGGKYWKTQPPAQKFLTEKCGVVWPTDKTMKHFEDAVGKPAGYGSAKKRPASAGVTAAKNQPGAAAVPAAKKRRLAVKK